MNIIKQKNSLHLLKNAKADYSGPSQQVQGFAVGQREIRLYSEFCEETRESIDDKKDGVGGNKGIVTKGKTHSI